MSLYLAFCCSTLLEHKDIMIAGLKRLRSKVGALKKDMEYDIFREADVVSIQPHCAFIYCNSSYLQVCTTCLSAGSLTMNAMDFPVVFLDEASMSTEPASLIPLMRGVSEASDPQIIGLNICVVQALGLDW